MEIILASASERRKELLKRIVNDYEVITSDFDESKVEFHGSEDEYVMKIAEGKALTVAKKFSKGNKIVIGCDTAVFFENKVLGKPKNHQDAFEMLNMLSGNVHKVYSGLAIVDISKNIVKKECVCTEVKFSKLSTDQILNYIKTGEPMDKAGAYGIQGYGGIFVEKIHGCYYNVVGLPINKLYGMLKEISAQS